MTDVPLNSASLIQSTRARRRMQLKPDKLLHEAQVHFHTAEQLIRYGSNTREGMIARYIVRSGLKGILARAFGNRKAERPLKLFIDMLEQRGVTPPGTVELAHIHIDSFEYIDVFDKELIQIITDFPLYPQCEEDREAKMEMLDRIANMIRTHGNLAMPEHRAYHHHLAMLRFAYFPAGGNA